MGHPPHNSLEIEAEAPPRDTVGLGRRGVLVAAAVAGVDMAVAVVDE